MPRRWSGPCYHMIAAMLMFSTASVCRAKRKRIADGCCGSETGLPKVKILHALARADYYGQRGRISSREVYDIMKTCSRLTFILARIIYWQAREISRSAQDGPNNPEHARVCLDCGL